MTWATIRAIPACFEVPIFSIRQLLGLRAPTPQPPFAPAADPAQAAAALKAEGNTWLARGDVAQAARCYQRACELAPSDALAWLNLGYASLELGDLDAAGRALDRSLALDRTVADTHFFQAQLKRRQHRPLDALPSLRQALTLNIAFAEAAELLVVTLLDARRPQEALAEVERLIGHKSTLGLQLLHVRALVAAKRGPDALALAQSLVDAAPQNLDAVYARAQALFELRRYEDALDACAAVLRVRSDHLEAMVNSGAACVRLGHWDDARAFYDRALEIRPDHLPAIYNKSSLYQELARIPEMVELVERGLAIQPGDPMFIWSRGIARLLSGDLAGGFQDYEMRWAVEVFEVRPSMPQWLGEDLRGKTIYVYNEQGLGDTLQMLRYVPMLVALGAHVLLRIQPPLAPLCEGWSGCTLWRERGHPDPSSYDAHCPMLSLPMAFGTVLQTVPWSGPYLKAEPQLRAEWERWLGPRGGLRVGLVWSGNADHGNDSNRSMRLETMLVALRGGGHQLVSLQKEVRAADTEALAAISHAGERLRSFADTAALVDCMDVVLSVDTSVAHLAGALGKKLWVLLAQAPDWRWLITGDSSPWYPQARLFRQGEDRQWGPVLARVAGDLALERHEGGQ